MTAENTPQPTDLNEETRTIWDHNAAFWDDRMGDGNDFQRILTGPASERLLNLQAGETVLEIACGNGVFSRRMAQLGVHVVATDFSEQLLERARAHTTEYADRIEYRLLDATREDQIVALGQQHYYRTGGEKPSLILLHGFTENGLCWSRVAKAMEDDYDLIMVDARGHGRSSGPETGYAQELLTRDVAEIIRMMGLHRPCLFGFSNGAVTAAQVAANFPDLVRAVILEDSPWRETIRQSPPMQADGSEPWPGYTAWHQALRTQTLGERLVASRQFLPAGTYEWPEEELVTHLEAQAQFNLDVLNVVPPLPMPSPWRETVESIACPILLLTGNPARGAMVTPEVAQQVAAMWQQGQHVAFAEASHFLHHEMQGTAFDHFIQVVKAFLCEQEARG